MKPFLAPGAMLLALCALALPASSQDEVVLKKNHHVLHGKAVSSTPDSVTFDHIVDGQSIQVHTFSADELMPVSFYVIRLHAVEGDAKGCMELGQFCLDNGFNARARNLFETAARLDPSLAEKAQAPTKKAREASAAKLLENAQSYHSEGKPDHAWGALQECIRNFGDTAAGQEGKGLVQSYFDAYQKRYTLEGVAGDKSGDPAQGTVQKTLAEASKLNTEALSEKNTSQSLRMFDRSASEYDRALKMLQEQTKEGGGDADQQEALASLVAEAKRGFVHAHLNKAGIYMTRTSFQDALRETQQALAVDPDSADAKAYRSRVATVAGLSR